MTAWRAQRFAAPAGIPRLPAAGILARECSACFDEAAFRANIEKLCAFCDHQGVAAAHKDVLAAEALFPGLRLVCRAELDPRLREDNAGEAQEVR